MSKHSKRGQSTLNGVAAGTEVCDWTERFIPRIEGQQFAVAGIDIRRRVLEPIVEPYVTKKKTGDRIAFRGKLVYFQTPQRGSERDLVWAAIFALQCIYRIDAALETNDINEAMHAAAVFGVFDCEVTAIQRCGVGMEAFALVHLRTTGADGRCRLI